MKVLAADIGEKRIGLAKTDDLGIIASGFGAIPRDNAEETIAKIVADENIETLVVGMPGLPSGGLGSQSEDVVKFIEGLKEKLNIPIETENEVLTSVEAENRLKAIGKRNIEKAEIDEMAAIIILESFLRR